MIDTCRNISLPTVIGHMISQSAEVIPRYAQYGLSRTAGIPFTSIGTYLPSQSLEGKELYDAVQAASLESRQCSSVLYTMKAPIIQAWSWSLHARQLESCSRT